MRGYEKMSEEINQIEEAKKAAAELNAATDRLQKLLESENKERVREILSGQATAGQIAPVEDINKKRTEEINQWLKGTGLHI